MWAIWGSRDGLGAWLGGLRLSISPALRALHVQFARYRYGIMSSFRGYPISTNVGSIDESADRRDGVISGTV